LEHQYELLLPSRALSGVLLLSVEVANAEEGSTVTVVSGGERGRAASEKKHWDSKLEVMRWSSWRGSLMYSILPLVFPHCTIAFKATKHTLFMV